VSATWYEADCVHGRLKGPEEIQTVFQRAGVDLKQPLVTSCGTGVTASVLALALHQLSPNPQVHDMQNTLTLQNCIPGNCVGSDWATSWQKTLLAVFLFRLQSGMLLWRVCQGSLQVPCSDR